ncbi:MAG: LamG domain-containing protein, partial [Lacisediminihabitans sp.]
KRMGTKRTMNLYRRNVDQRWVPFFRNSRPRLAAILIAVSAMIAAPLVVAAPAQASGCTTYYVSSVSGSDSNSGCSASTAWQTLSNVNATTFAAGNQILFQNGSAWSGQLHPLGSGVSGNSIVISNYGTGSAPIINGGGVAATVYLLNQQYWTVQNLEITNTSASPSVRAGFLAENDTSGILNGIHVVNMNIHNVLGYWKNSTGQPSQDSGISFNLSDSYSTNGWNDILISGNTLNSVDAGGIYVGSVNESTPIHQIITTNVVVQNNTMNDLGGNDIVLLYASNPIVQYNVVTNSGYRYSGAGFWMALNNGGLWQYNEISRQWRQQWDGQAFDIDHDNNGVIVQYNYTHDNPFGQLEFCCSSTFGGKNSIIRDNVSQNDGTMDAVWATLNGVTSSGNAQFYNNTVYEGQPNTAPITQGVASSNNVVFSNNLIYKLGTGGYATGETWTHNLFYGNHPSSEPSDASKITSDPLLVAPGGASTGRSSASAYQLLTGSPAIGAGTLISGNGGLDYFGNAVSSTAAPSIGAYNGSGTSLPASSSGAYYNLDQGAGTRVPDINNHSNTGTLQAGASWTTGKIGPYAAALSGASNSYVDIPTTDLNTSSSYSVSAWVKLNSVAGNQTFASIDGTNISPFYLQLEGGALAFTARNSDSTGSTATIVTGPTAVAGTWYQLIGVYNATAGTVSLYVNGVRAGSAPFTAGWAATGHTEIGRAKWAGKSVDFVNGAIDDVRFIPSAITENQAFALGTGATAYYSFDEGAGSTTGDFITGTTQGQLFGDATWTTGKVGAAAVAVDGTPHSSVEINATPVDTSSSYSVTGWVKFNTAGGSNQTAISIDGQTGSGFYVQQSGGHLAYVVRSADSTSSTATSIVGPAVTAGTWYQVAATFDITTNTTSFYVNGTLAGTASFTTPWRAIGEVLIGRGQWNSAPVDWTNGAVDDVHFYSRALSSSEVMALASL